MRGRRQDGRAASPRLGDGTRASARLRRFLSLTVIARRHAMKGAQPSFDVSYSSFRCPVPWRLVRSDVLCLALDSFPLNLLQSVSALLADEGMEEGVLFVA